MLKLMNFMHGESQTNLNSEGVVMDTFKSRLFEEKEELAARTKKLNDFIDSGKFLSLSKGDREDLIEQFNHMSGYLAVLNKRVARYCSINSSAVFAQPKQLSGADGVTDKDIQIAKLKSDKALLREALEAVIDNIIGSSAVDIESLVTRVLDSTEDF